MSILNVVGAKIWGGGEQYVYDICQQLQQRHRTAHILVDQSNVDMQERYAQVGHVMTGNLYTLKGFLSINAVAKEVKEKGINTIICHSGKYILFCIALKHLTGAKLVFIKHNLVAGKTDLYHRWINEQVDAFVCVSKLVYDDLMTPAIKDASKYYIVYNGINPKRFLSFAEGVPMKDKVTTFGYCARITERKGLYLILKALEEIHHKNSTVRLLISGAGTEDQIKKLTSYMDAHQMHSYVKYIGFTRDIEALYNSIDCLLLPTITREAFGLVICEAMYCGVPVITSSLGAQRELIDHGSSGFIVEPLNEDTLQQVMEYVMSDSVDLPKIITNARHVVEQRFIINRVADELVSIIDNIHSTNH